MEPNEQQATPPPAPVPPVPVQALDYSAPRPSRPGILTAVGVLSLVIGALSALMGCSSAFTSVMFQYMPQMTPVVPATAPATGPAAPATGTVSTVTVTRGAAPAAMFASGPRDASALALGITDAVLRLGLAVLLIVAGVFVFRDHRLGRKLHIIWAWLKIPVALLGAVAYWRTMSGMFASMPATPGSPVTPQYMDMMMLAGGLFQAAIACAYPVGVLIVMKTRTVRDYYATQLGVRS